VCPLLQAPVRQKKQAYTCGRGVAVCL